MITLYGLVPQKSDLARLLLFFPREEQDFASLVVTIQRSDGGLLQGSFRPASSRSTVLVEEGEYTELHLLAYDSGEVIGCLLCTRGESGQWEIQYSRGMDLQFQVLDPAEFKRRMSQKPGVMAAPLYAPEWYNIDERDPEDAFYLNQIYIQRLLREYLGVSDYECSDCYNDSFTQRLPCFLSSYWPDEKRRSRRFLASKSPRRFLPVELLISELIRRKILPEGLYSVLFVSGADALRRNAAFQETSPARTKTRQRAGGQA